MAQRHPHGLVLLGGVVAVLSVAVALAMVWLDNRRRRGEITRQHQVSRDL